MIERNKNRIEIPVKIDWKFGRGWRKIGFLGIGLDVDKVVWPKDKIIEYKSGFFEAFVEAKNQMGLFLDLNKIIIGKIFTGKISTAVLGGPIATFEASGKALEHGFISFIGFLAMISLTIAIINLLPLPALDGGYIILILIEAIRRRPLSVRTQELIFRIGLIIFLLLILHTTANDLIRIFGG